MDQFDFLDGMTGLQRRLLDLCRAMSESESDLVSAKELLKALAVEDWKMAEEDFEQDCEEMTIKVGPIESYPQQSVGYAYRVLLRMGTPWRIRYPYFEFRGMYGDPHDDQPSGLDDVSLRLSNFANILLPATGAPLLPVALLNGVLLPEGTQIPSHNLQELWMAYEEVRQNPAVTLEELMEALPGPDFCSGGVAGGVAAIRSLYDKGKGDLVVRADIREEIEGGRTRISIQSLPPGVLIQTAIEQIRELGRRERIYLYGIKDTSTRYNTKITLDLPRRWSTAAVKEILFKETDLEKRVPFRLSIGDWSGWPQEGGLIAILKAAVGRCGPAWGRKDGGPTDHVPFLRDILELGGYKSPLSDLTDDRRSRLLDIA